MINWRDIANLQIFQSFTLKKNAVMKLELPNGTTSNITPGSLTAAYTETLTTTRTVLAEESGKTFILNAAAAFVTTLPLPAAGLRYKFIIGATAPTTSHTVVTNGSANIIYGNIVSAGGLATTSTNPADTITFTANVAVRGDSVDIWSDGVAWYATGMNKVQTGVTLTLAS